MSVWLEWLRTLFWKVNDYNDSSQIECAIFLLGYTLFVDKSFTRVSVAYLKLLTNLWEVRDYAWGATALAYLYHQLGMTKWVGVKQMVGYITLLKCWIYEHFPHLTPNRNLSYTGNELQAYRWTLQKETETFEDNLRVMWETLDALGVNEVCWTPYDDPDF